MLNALESTLTKLARFDEGNLLAPILSITYKQGMSSSGRDIGKQYVAFASNCCDLIRHKINDELWIVNLLEVSPPQDGDSIFAPRTRPASNQPLDHPAENYRNGTPPR